MDLWVERKVDLAEPLDHLQERFAGTYEVYRGRELSGPLLPCPRCGMPEQVSARIATLTCWDCGYTGPATPPPTP